MIIDLTKICRNVLTKPKSKIFGKKVTIFALIFLAALNNGVHSQDTILIMTYNLLNFTETSSNRTEHFKTVIDHINPDILVVQEMISQQSLNIFHSVALNDRYSAGTFIDGPDSDNAENLKDTPIINSVPILQGWNLISVLSETPISINEAFGGNFENIVIIKEAVGLKLYWPEQEIETLQMLEPKKGYLINFSFIIK